MSSQEKIGEVQQTVEAQKTGKGRAHWIRQELVSLAIVLAAVTAARSSLADHYYVPSGSMENSLIPGDRVFVDKTGQTRDACRAYVWNAHTGEHIEFCSPRVDEHNARAKDTAKRRKAKAFSAAVSRAQKRAEAITRDHGVESNEAKAALRDVEVCRASFQAWRKRNPPQRPGRPEKSIPRPEPDIVLPESRRGE